MATFGTKQHVQYYRTLCPLFDNKFWLSLFQKRFDVNITKKARCLLYVSGVGCTDCVERMKAIVNITKLQEEMKVSIPSMRKDTSRFISNWTESVRKELYVIRAFPVEVRDILLSVFKEVQMGHGDRYPTTVERNLMESTLDEVVYLTLNSCCINELDEQSPVEPFISKNSSVTEKYQSEKIEEISLIDNSHQSCQSFLSTLYDSNQETSSSDSCKENLKKSHNDRCFIPSIHMSRKKTYPESSVESFDGRRYMFHADIGAVGKKHLQMNQLKNSRLFKRDEKSGFPELEDVSSSAFESDSSTAQTDVISVHRENSQKKCITKKENPSKSNLNTQFDDSVIVVENNTPTKIFIVALNENEKLSESDSSTGFVDSHVTVQKRCLKDLLSDTPVDEQTTTSGPKKEFHDSNRDCGSSDSDNSYPHEPESTKDEPEIEFLGEFEPPSKRQKTASEHQNRCISSAAQQRCGEEICRAANSFQAASLTQYQGPCVQRGIKKKKSKLKKGQRTQPSTFAQTRRGNSNKQNFHPGGQKPIFKVLCADVTNQNSSSCSKNQPAKDRVLRPIVIDGSNVAWAHGKDGFSWKGIKQCVDFFVKRGHKDITVFLSQFKRKFGQDVKENQEIVKYLEDNKFVTFTPSRYVKGKLTVSYEDRFIVKLATENNGVMVSNDYYRDLLDVSSEWKKTIEERLLLFCFVGDLFMVPDDPCGRNGVMLDEFLSFEP